MDKAWIAFGVLAAFMFSAVLGVGIFIISLLSSLGSVPALLADPCLIYKLAPESSFAAIDPSLLPETIDLDKESTEIFGGIVAQAQSMSKGGNNAAAVAGMTAYAESKIGRTDLDEIAAEVDGYHGIFQQAPAWFPDISREVFATENDPRNNPGASSQRFLWAFYSVVSGEKKSVHESPAAIKTALTTLGVSSTGTPEQRWKQFQQADLSNVFKAGNIAGMDAFLVLTNAVQGHLTQGGILKPSNYSHISAVNFKNAFNAMAPQMQGLYGSGIIAVSGTSQQTEAGTVILADTDSSEESFIGDLFFTKKGVLSSPEFPRTAYVDAQSGMSLNEWALSKKKANARAKVAKKTGSVTVSLGYQDLRTTGMSFSSKIDALMKVVGNERPVYWYTLHSVAKDTFYYDTKTNETYASHNDDLREAAQRYPNLKIIESGAIVDKKPLEYIGLDGLSLSPAGYALMWELRQGKAEVSYVASPGSISVPSECLSVLGAFSSQQTVGLDGLPLTAPADALKDGITQEQFVALGQSAVATAPTPQAALAIKWALTHLGIPYACSGDGGVYSPPKTYLGVSYSSQYTARAGPNAYDCSSFVNAAYRDGAGMTDMDLFSTLSMGRYGKGTPNAIYQRVDRREMQPGDLIPYNSGSGDNGGHVVMYLGQSPATRDMDGRLIQSDDEWVTDTGTCGDVSRVKKLDRAYMSRIDPNWNVVRPMPTNPRSTASIEEKVAQTQGGLNGG